MPKLSDIRRIIPEDFKQEDQDVAQRIAGSYNDFADELYEVVNGQLDFDNLARRKISIDVNISSTGKISGTTTAVTNLSFVSGINVIKVDNLSNTTAIPTSAPFVGFVYQGSGRFTISYILGIPSGKWRLTLEVIQ